MASELKPQGGLSGSLSQNIELKGAMTNLNELNGSLKNEVLRGYSAYQVAVALGFEGTEQEWLESLKGGGSADLSNYYTKKETNDKFATKEDLENVAVGDIDLSSYYTKTESDNKYQPKGNYLTEHQDLSSYAKKTELPKKVSELENDKGYLTKIPSEYVTEQELNGKGYLTEHQSLDAYAKKTDIPTDYAKANHNHDGKYQPVGNYALKNEIPTSPSQVGAEPSGTAEAKVNTHNTSEEAHNDIRLLVSNLRETVAKFLDVDDVTVDQLSEVLKLINDNKGDLESLTTSKVNVLDIIDNLTTSVSNKPLSAKQGVVLKALINAITVPTKTSQLTNDSNFVTKEVTDELSREIVNHEDDTTKHITSIERTKWNKNTTDILDLQSELEALISTKAVGSTLEEQIAWLEENGDTSKEYLLLDNHYYSYQPNGSVVYTNLFSFENANNDFSWISGSTTDMIYMTSSDYGYKDTSNNRFVSKKTMNDGRFAVTGGIATLPNGDYVVSADVFIPNTAPNLNLTFGVCLIPNAKSSYNNYTISSKDKWETLSYDFSVTDGNLYTYVAMMGGQANTSEIYWRNVKVISKNDKGTQTYGWVKTDKDVSSSGSNIKKWLGKKWVALGDSLTEANRRTDKNYHDYIAEETGIEVVNMGASGTGYKRTFDSNTAFYQRILSVPTDADVVTIFGSGNDLSTTWNTYGLGNVTDTGTDTICGCINKTIDNLYSVLPTAQLGIITPTPWDCFYPSATADPQNRMSLYSEAIVKICEMRGIPCLDLYHCSNLRPWDSSFKTLAYSKDDGGGTHPDETGHLMIAPRIKAFLESLLF